MIVYRYLTCTKVNLNCKKQRPNINSVVSSNVLRMSRGSDIHLAAWHAQVRWWDSEVDTSELLKYTPYQTNTPTERWMFSNAIVSHHHRKEEHLVYEYMTSYQSLRPEVEANKTRVGNASERRWIGVRVTLPAGANFADGHLCCHSAYEIAGSHVAEVVLVEC